MRLRDGAAMLGHMCVAKVITEDVSNFTVSVLSFTFWISSASPCGNWV